MLSAAPFLYSYLKSNLRGADRLTALLARHVKSFQMMPIRVEDAPPVYVDLRLAPAREWFRNNVDSAEDGLRAVMKRFVKSGSVVYDVGANMGFYTVLLSQLVRPTGKVFAFEPNPQLFVALNETFKRTGNAELIPVGLLNQEATLEFYIPADHTMASLRNWTGLKTTKTTVPVRRLDHLGLPRPQFIKCDVEGFELEVFQGAEPVIRDNKPTIVFESYSQTCPNHTAATCFLQSLGYRIYVISRNGGLSVLESLDYEAADLLAVADEV